MYSKYPSLGRRLSHPVRIFDSDLRLPTLNVSISELVMKNRYVLWPSTTSRRRTWILLTKWAQFECMQAAHIVYMVLDQAAPSPLFRAPVGDNLQNILDIGTGHGPWAREVADRFPGGKSFKRSSKDEIVNSEEMEGGEKHRLLLHNSFYPRHSLYPPPKT